MHISKVEIKNIRSIEHLNMSFKKGHEAGWHVIIGDNGSGKSSVMKSIALALVGTSNALALREDYKKWVRVKSNNSNIELNVNRSQSWDQIIGLPDESYAEITDVNAALTFRDKDGNHISPRMPENYPVAARMKGWSPPFWSHLYRGWFSAGFGPMRRFEGGDSELNQLFDSHPKLASHLSLFKASISMRYALEWLEDLDYKRLKSKEDKTSDHHEKIFNSVRQFINLSNLLPHDAKFDKMSTEGPLFMDGNGFEIQAIDLSDGYRSVLSLIFEILRQLINSFGVEKVLPNLEKGDVTIPVPGVVLIDEVDAHLHPSWQTKIGEWFTKLFPKMQFIVTTHSPLICRAASKGTIWRMAKPGSDEPNIRELKGIEKDKLVFGNILDAYGTEVFGTEPVHFAENDERKERLGYLNVRFAVGKLTEKEKKEMLQLRKTLSTDAATGF